MKITLYKRIIVVAVGLLLVVSAGMSIHSITSTTPVIADLETLPTIIIDPGHGGMDGGAVGVENIVEKDINLAISLTLRDLFVVNGFQVVMTRDTDISIHDEGVTGIRKQKTSDLRNRLAIMNQYPNVIFISVHQNKFGDKRSSGTQVFYSPNNPDSKALAEIVQAKFIAQLQHSNTRLTKKAGKNLYLMYQAKCPAILIECGFLSNAQEAGLLIDEDYQRKMAFTAFCSVMEYLQLDQPVSPGTTGT